MQQAIPFYRRDDHVILEQQLLVYGAHRADTVAESNAVLPTPSSINEIARFGIRMHNTTSKGQLYMILFY